MNGNGSLTRETHTHGARAAHLNAGAGLGYRVQLTAYIVLGEIAGS